MTIEVIFDLILFLLALTAQTVLALLNVTYITMESHRLDASDQRTMRLLSVCISLGLKGLAILILGYFAPVLSGYTLFSVQAAGQFSISLTAFDMLGTAGGLILLWISIREIFHLLLVDQLEHVEAAGRKSKPSVLSATSWVSTLYSAGSLALGAMLASSWPGLMMPILLAWALVLWLSDHVARIVEHYRGLMIIGLLLVLIVGLFIIIETGMTGINLGGTLLLTSRKSGLIVMLLIILGIAAAQTGYRRHLVQARDEAAKAGIPTCEPDRTPLFQKANSSQ